MSIGLYADLATPRSRHQAHIGACVSLALPHWRRIGLYGDAHTRTWIPFCTYLDIKTILEDRGVSEDRSFLYTHFDQSLLPETSMRHCVTPVRSKRWPASGSKRKSGSHSTPEAEIVAADYALHTHSILCKIFFLGKVVPKSRSSRSMDGRGSFLWIPWAMCFPQALMTGMNPGRKKKIKMIWNSVKNKHLKQYPIWFTLGLSLVHDFHHVLFILKGVSSFKRKFTMSFSGGVTRMKAGNQFGRGKWTSFVSLQCICPQQKQNTAWWQDCVVRNMCHL